MDANDTAEFNWNDVDWDAYDQLEADRLWDETILDGLTELDDFDLDGYIDIDDEEV